MKKEKWQRGIAIVGNLLNVILVAVSIAWFFTASGAGNMAVAGARCFRYFTIDSNVLSAVTSAVMIFFLLRGRIPAWAVMLKHIGTAAVTVTLLTVVFFLGPTQGYPQMFDGVCLFLHLICPLLAIATTYLPEAGKPLPKSAWFCGDLPVIVYGILYGVMVVLLHKWEDFYGFNMGGRWYVSVVVMFLLGAILSLVMAALQRARVKAQRKGK